MYLNLLLLCRHHKVRQLPQGSDCTDNKHLTWLCDKLLITLQSLHLFYIRNKNTVHLKMNITIKLYAAAVMSDV